MIRRLLLSYLSVTAIVLLLLEVPLGYVFAERERERLILQMERDASVLASIYEEPLEYSAPLDPADAESYERDTGARVVIVDGVGVSVLDTDLGPGRDYSTRPEITTALSGARSTGTRHSETLELDLRFVAIPIASEGRVIGVIRLTAPTADIDNRIRAFRWGLVGLGVVVLGAMALIGWLIARSVSRPVRELESVARRLSGGELTARAEGLDAVPEVRRLGETFDEMADRIQEHVAAQQDFVGDASHQLRTPLTALRLRLENLGPSVDADGAADLEGALAETDRLAALIGQLLRLARIDQAPEVTSQDLVAASADRAELWSAVADERDIDIVTRLPETAVAVLAFPGAIEQILDNVLENALDASDDGTTIVVSVAGDGGGADTLVALSVDDEGRGMTSEQRARAFDRFWRAPDNNGPGTGLGLAIVRDLAAASSGTAELSSNERGGTTVMIRFKPAAGSTAVER